MKHDINDAPTLFVAILGAARSSYARNNRDAHRNANRHRRFALQAACARASKISGVRAVASERATPPIWREAGSGVRARRQRQSSIKFPLIESTAP